MKKYLLDTKPAQQFINYFGNIRQRVAYERQRGWRIGICMPVLGELWSGVAGSNDPEKNRRRLRQSLSQLIVWPYELDAAAEFGRLFMELKRMGRPMQQIDIQIAAIAFTLGNCTIVTADSDFAAIPNLTIENWEATAEST